MQLLVEVTYHLCIVFYALSQFSAFGGSWLAFSISGRPLALMQQQAHPIFIALRTGLRSVMATMGVA